MKDRTKEEMYAAYVQMAVVDYGYNGNVGPNGDWGDQGEDHFASPVDIDTEPIMLIEYSKYGQTWITLHPTLQAACDANVNQEYADDWQYPTIYDVAHDVWYEVEYLARAVPIKEGANA